MKPPLRIAVTGAAGNIAYALLPRIAAGDMLGREQPVMLAGVVMELQDCAFPLLAGLETSDDANAAFDGADCALLVGSKPRGKGMERGDLLKDNGKIFSAQGKALNARAARGVKAIAAANAPDLAPAQITAMTRLDHNRAKSLLAAKLGAHPKDIRNMTIWGNHSSTQYPDITNAQVMRDGKPEAAAALVGQEWLERDFIPAVQQRGAAIIAARGASSAASAASAAIDHMRDWACGGAAGDWVSMAVAADGSYGIEKGLIYSFPVVCENGGYRIVDGLDIGAFSGEKMRASEAELLSERAAVADLL